MKEQEQYKAILKKLIDQAEDFEFSSTDELLGALVEELTKSRMVTAEV